MNAFIAGLLFQAFGLLIGTMFAYMGYKLFIKGTFETSDVEAVWKDKKLLLRRGTPGTIFALFGVGVIGIAVLKPLAVEKKGAFSIDDDVLAILQKVVTKRFVDEKESMALEQWIQQVNPTFESVKYVHDTHTKGFPMPADAIMTKLADGESLSCEEKIVFLEWYVTTDRLRGIQWDIANSIDSAFFFARKLEEPEKLQLKAWLTEVNGGQFSHYSGTIASVNPPKVIRKDSKTNVNRSLPSQAPRAPSP